MISKLFVLSLFIIFILGFGFTEMSITEQLQNSKDTISLMQSKGLTTNRINDLYFVAESLYTQQIDQNTTNFLGVSAKLSELKLVSDQAFNVVDEFKLFEIELSDANKIIDVKEVIPIYIVAKQELIDERYSNALDKLVEARQKIAELKSFGSRASAISQQLGKGVFSFFNAIKYWLLGIVIFIVLIYILFKKKINKYILNRKYKKYDQQKIILQKLIKKLQTDYFMGNSTSETSYKVKVKKYDDLINDINREMAILKEDLLK